MLFVFNWFNTHSWSYSIKHITTKNICHISFVLARSLGESGQDDLDMIREYQLKSGHRVFFDWGKTSGFWMFLSLFKLLLELAVTVNVFFFHPVWPTWPTFAATVLHVSPSGDFMDQILFFIFLPFSTSSVLSFIFPVCSLMFWGLGNNLVSVLSTVTSLLILLFYLFLLVFSDTFCICTP